MGNRNSMRRNRMEDRETGENARSGPGAGNESSSGGQGQGQGQGGGGGGGDDHTNNQELATILQYLIRSGQVRILASGSGGLSSDGDDYEDDDMELIEPASEPSSDPNPDTTNIAKSQFAQEVLQQCGISRVHRCGIHVGDSHQPSVYSMLHKREVGWQHQGSFTNRDCNLISSNYLPNSMKYVARYHQKAFCGTYTTDGDIFLSACQDQNVRIYDTKCGLFKMFKSIRARDVGWSILDTAVSPDGHYLIYSSWSDSIHLCNIYGDHETHVALPLNPDANRTAIFSLTFSTDNTEILGGANDGHIYVFNRERNERTLKIDSHEDDVNAVAFADSTSQILFSGGDDGLVKVWDRRTLSDESPNPVGVLAGHMDGITHIDSKGDARYLISNCKDQCIKLWDMRNFSTNDTVQATKREVAKQNWDYRWQQVPHKLKTQRTKKIVGDSSLMTYRGHSVLHTLVRSRFSPQFTTGHRYIYTGCATGAIVIYDALTGKIVKKLKGQRACVRDVSWHPYEHSIISTSWDGTLCQWTYLYQDISDSEMEVSSSDEDDGSYSGGRRRSKRLRRQARGGWRRQLVLT